MILIEIYSEPLTELYASYFVQSKFKLKPMTMSGPMASPDNESGFWFCPQASQGHTLLLAVKSPRPPADSIVRSRERMTL